jgi:hypothetical protein
MNVDQILNENGLDFSILKERLTSPSGALCNEWGLTNTKLNKVIHTVKEGYHVTQNREVVELVLEGMKPFGGQLAVSKAGSIAEGRKIFVQLAIEGIARVGGDALTQYVTILDSNDGSTGLAVGIGDFTASCTNQFRRFYKDADMRFRHTANSAAKLARLPKMIEKALGLSMRQIELYNNFQSTSVSRELAHAMVNHIMGFDKVLTSAEDLAQKSTRSINKMNLLYDAIFDQMDDKGDNLWGLHSGVTKFTTHFNNSKAAVAKENGVMANIMLGQGELGSYSLNQKSLNFATEQLILS